MRYQVMNAGLVFFLLSPLLTDFVSFFFAFEMRSAAIVRAWNGYR